MNTDLMIKMLNEIGAFFDAEPDKEAAARDVKSHVRRYWEPRMRAQLLEYFEQRQGAGLSEIAVKAVELLAAEARAAAAASGAAAAATSGPANAAATSPNTTTSPAAKTG